jgi:hypothetical protein
VSFDPRDGGVAVYASRHTPGITGDKVAWEIGERTRVQNMRNPEDDGKWVTIKSHFKKHDAAPGELVVEVVFDGESGLVAVRAKCLEVRP